MRGLYILIDDTSRVAGKYTIIKGDPQKSENYNSWRMTSGMAIFLQKAKVGILTAWSTSDPVHQIPLSPLNDVVHRAIYGATSVVPSRALQMLTYCTRLRTFYVCIHQIMKRLHR